MRSLIAVGISACLLGCAPTVTKVQTVEKFIAADAQYIMDVGPHTIAGQAFMRTVGGEVRTCAGLEVSLFPVTPYSSERMQVLYGSTSAGFRSANAFAPRLDPGAADPQYMHYSRKTVCDASGRFEFQKAADGSYFVIATVIWSTGQPYSPPQGGFLMRRVMAGSESENLILSP
jgi:hypothetical protein